MSTSNKVGCIQAGSRRPPGGGSPRLYLVQGGSASALRRHQIANDLLDALDEHAIVSVADVDGRIIYVNDRFCEVSGYARDDLIGQDHRIVKSGEHPQAFYEAMWGTISAGRVWHGVLTNRRKDGEPYWVESTIIPVVGPEGRPERYVSIRTDITRQKTLEQAVREQQAFLSEVTESVGEGLLVTDARGRCVFASAEALRLLRRSREQLVGQPLAALRADVPAAPRGERPRAAPDWPSGRYPAALLRGDGRRLSASLNVRKLRRGRRDHGAVILFHDDSAERRHQADIERQRLEAERANRAKTAFLANLSHEIRTPLNGVLGLVRLAREEPPGSERLAEFLRRIEDSALALSELVSGVLDLSKIEAGKLSLERVVIDLHELMRSIWEGYVELAQQRGLSLQLQVADGVPRHVLADPMRVRQIVVNFVANALKFTAQGSVVLSVAPAPGGAVRIAVADTGIGIEPEVRAELFRPFVQGDDTTTRRYGGTGLGLSICRELATQMGGSVGVDSLPGQGSTFWADLPLPARTPEGGPPAPPVAPETPLRGRRVLLVEDNDVNLFIARAMLERWGCEVDEATNGAEALELLNGAPDRYDLVLMDLQMPVMGGREATLRIRERFSPQELPVVALTAAALAQERDECLALGMNDYLTKPIDTAALQACIARLCAGP